MKRKPVPSSTSEPVIPETKPLELPLASGDMILTWVPLRPIGCTASLSGKVGGGAGRINITLRKALVRGGMENYYQHNVGSGGVFRWDDKKQEMVSWEAVKGAA